MTNEELFENQKTLLDTLLGTGAITQAQHDYSLSCLEKKMKIKKEEPEKKESDNQKKDK
ncbi:MAG: hypothetical protein MJ068_02295 [Clostridia bacterium]|nr:hypothetical protein [Clostridia bacterium]